MLSSPHIDWLDHRFLAFTRLAQRSLTLQPGHSLISPKLTLSVGSSISITLHAATQARRLLALTAAGLLSLRESPYGSRQQFIWTHLQAILTTVSQPQGRQFLHFSGVDLIRPFCFASYISRIAMWTGRDKPNQRY